MKNSEQTRLRIKTLLQGEADVKWSNGYRPQVLADLGRTYPHNVYQNNEDAFQELLIKIYRPGIVILGERNLWMLKFHARREALRLMRHSNTKRRRPDGGFGSFDDVSESRLLEDSGFGEIEGGIAFWESFGDVIQKTTKKFGERDEAVANALIRSQMFDPSSRQLYAGMTTSERERFRPKVSCSKKKMEKFAVRAISRRIEPVQRAFRRARFYLEHEMGETNFLAA